MIIAAFRPFRGLALVRAAVLGLAAAFGAPPAEAECSGSNILDTLPAAERGAVEAAAAAVPFASGNFWTARKGAAQVTVIGTYHLDDPRHAATIAALSPVVGGAEALLVEAGPQEERALLDHIARDPSVMTITTGPTLLELLPREIWQQLARAMEERGIPGFMAAKFRPWYVTALLSMPPCALGDMANPKGLDGLLVDAALSAGVPVRALEPYDTVFRIFDSLTTQEQIEMIEQTLALEPAIEDYSVTLADIYFAGESRLMWELMRHQSYAMPGTTKAEVDTEMARMEQVLMADRNRAWIPVIETAAAHGPLVVAFGALHLSGEAGVLNLLAESGWTVAPMKLP